MSSWRLVWQGVKYYWRTNLAVFFGVLVATAVMAGALIVGDSVRASLSRMSLERLGKIDHVVRGNRFFGEELASRLTSDELTVAPALVMTGSVEQILEADSDENVSTPRSRVTVYGVDERLWELTNHGDVGAPSESDIILSDPVAKELQAGAGDEVSLWIELPKSIPRDTLLGGTDDEVSEEIVLTVSTALPTDSGVGRLDLNPNQQLPKNVFVNLGALQQALGLEAIRRSARNPREQRQKVNALFAGHVKDGPQQPHGLEVAEGLSEKLKAELELDDLGLRIDEVADPSYLSLESSQMFIEAEFIQVAKAAASEVGASSSPILVYLANEFRNPEKTDHVSMYGVVAGMDLSSDASPFGPFTFTAGKPPGGEGDGREVVLNKWLADDLNAEVGDELELAYHVVGSHGELPEEVRTFRVSGIVELTGPADDRNLAPDVPGITDARTFRDWKQPFPMDLNRIPDRDEDYWEMYKATPKAFTILPVAQDLWRSRYGQVTSFRLAPTADENRTAFVTAFRERLDLAKLGMNFQPVKEMAITASSGTTPFSALFLGFSHFLILSSAILIGLMFRLGVERRVQSVGLLHALGFSRQAVSRLVIGEGACVVLAGGLFGLCAAVGYAALMMHGLRTWWNDAVGTQFLALTVTPGSLILGYVTSVAVAGFAIVWALRGFRHFSIRQQLSGLLEQVVAPGKGGRSRRALRTSLVSGGLSALLIVLGLVGAIPASEAFSGLSWQVVAFGVSGVAALVGGVASINVLLDGDQAVAVRGQGFASFVRLGLRNAARHRQRSVMSVGLIACATFLIVAVAAGRRNPISESPDLASGNGGFLLVAESSSAIVPDLNTDEGRTKLNLNPNDDPKIAALLEKVWIASFRVRPGEDSSCLNIYQTQLPTILGVPDNVVARGGFKFVGAKRDNPWTVLAEEREDGAIPAFGDMNTLLYSLKKQPGAFVDVPADQPEPDYRFAIDGMFDGSVFQGVLLISDDAFDVLYPEELGFRYFLIGDRRFEEGQSQDAALSSEEVVQLTNLLESRLAEFGFDSEPVSQRLYNFLLVQNTYLETFQTLGGLGLLLGTFGLATVMVRNILERRAELALLRAVGYRNGHLGVLVLCESAFLLVWGLMLGAVSALVTMLPHLTSTGANAPWALGGAMLAAVFSIGLLASLFAVREAVRTPVLAGLRAE